MKKLLLAATLICCSFPATAFLIGEGTQRNTFQATAADSRTQACTWAKREAQDWLSRETTLSMGYTTTSSLGECQCDQPPPKRTGRKICPPTGFAVNICDASRLIDEVIEYPWTCAVDAAITRTKK